MTHDTATEVFAPPAVRESPGDRDFPGRRTLAFSGDWVALAIGGAEEAAAALAASPAGGPVAVFDLTGITRLDTTGALVINTLAASCREKGGTAALRTDDAHHKLLLDHTDVPHLAREKAAPHSGPLVRLVNQIGCDIVAECRLGGSLLSFLGHYLITLGQVALRPRTFRLTPLVYHMQQTGVMAVPIVALLSFLIGVVVAYMGAQQLARFGAQIFVVNLVEIMTLREMGVLLTSIIVAGRSGSSFTAQIGAMVANEEVAAMQSMGLSPMNRLVLPRVTALMLMLPALVFLADIMGLLGGGVAVWMTMDLSPEAYVTRLHESIYPSNFWTGMIKAPFFALVIGVVGCFQGFQVTGSAESVGRLTTQSVVESIFFVIVLDALFALFFTALGV